MKIITSFTIKNRKKVMKMILIKDKKLTYKLWTLSQKIEILQGNAINFHKLNNFSRKFLFAALNNLSKSFKKSWNHQICAI